MADTRIYLEPNKFYHVYNHGNGRDNLFFNENNYVYFLKKYKEYIAPVAETYAYCLMPNHFHFLIKIKSEEMIFNFLKNNNKLPEKNISQEEFELLFKNDSEINFFSLHISKQFSNLFNGYSQAINKQESRKGTLFARAFKRREVNSEEYLRSLILYIHLNPIHHGFVNKISEWKYLSYHSIVSEMATLIKRDEVVKMFDDLENFKFSHQQVRSNLLLEIDSSLN